MCDMSGVIRYSLREMKNKIKIEIELTEEDIAMIEADFWVSKGDDGLKIVIERIMHDKALAYKRAFPAGILIAREQYKCRRDEKKLNPGEVEKTAGENEWKTEEPPRDGSEIFAFGKVIETYGQDQFQVESFGKLIRYAKGMWVDMQGMALAQSFLDVVKINKWTRLPATND